MLASLLPGLRDVRAPLAAGYLWLVAAWVVFEPALPERTTAKGAVASLYRGGGVLSVLGRGIALSFAAYLLGSLSSNTLTPRLRRFLPKAWGASDRFDRWMTAPRVSLSPQARAALDQVVRPSQEQLTSSLALSGRGPDEFLKEFLDDQLDDQLIEEPEKDPRVKRSSRRRVWRGVLERVRRSARDKRAGYVGGGGRAGPVLGWDTQSEDPKAFFNQRIDRREAILAWAVLQDLKVVATTRLLGHDQALYSAVDRHRAEVEFRLAVIPPLLVLVISLGARADLWLLALLALLGVILARGLFGNAVESERTANEILLDSMADRRVRSPTLERLETQAAAKASQSDPGRMRTAAKDAVVALQGAAGFLEEAGRSEPALANRARRQIDVAQESVDQVSQLFPAPVARTAEQTLRRLREVADAWVGVMEGRGPIGFDTEARLQDAQKLLGDFQAQARAEVERKVAQAKASEPTGRAEPTT